MKLLLYFAALLVTVRGKYVKDITYFEFTEATRFSIHSMCLCIPFAERLTAHRRNFLCESMLNRKKLNLQEIVKAAIISFYLSRLEEPIVLYRKRRYLRYLSGRILKFQFPKLQTT